MGSRAAVVFVDGDKTSPGIYLHWDGHQVQGLLEEALPRLRRGDVGYSAARFCGVCHERISGNLSLGLIAPPSRDDSDVFNHGVFYVNVRTWEVEACRGNSIIRFQLDKSKVPEG
ncbi:MAG: hypothetical protein A2218_10435 [Elusimicrobia bacterium RIFOXYA2_FULL_53_38]|nr:MAG: hypothetical protein A2218_10435 [Elusimicrobia bacterium RIFOXYA2_FULL_53_38]